MFLVNLLLLLERQIQIPGELFLEDNPAFRNYKKKSRKANRKSHECTAFNSKNEKLLSGQMPLLSVSGKKETI